MSKKLPKPPASNLTMLRRCSCKNPVLVGPVMFHEEGCKHHDTTY